jgi:Bifunctional DNA primase/polymerase, N-terminal
MTMRLMGRALDLAERGWYVFPLRPGDKRPLPGFTNWEKRATIDREQIIRWWVEAPYNIGIATGPSALLVIDCDTAYEKDSLPWRLVGGDIEIAGNRLPRTFSVATPSGGQHLYFSARGRSLSNTVGKLGKHIDTRGIGGYVVGPGSVLRTGYYRIVTPSPVAELPDWIADALATHSFTVSTASPGQLRESDVQAILEREVQRVRTATPGSRNSDLNIAAFLLGKLADSGKITEREAWNILQTAAHRHIGLHGFTESEMNRTIRSGLAAGIRPGS